MYESRPTLYNVNVQQRVPINLERDNLPSAFLRRLRAEVLNLVADELTARPGQRVLGA